VRVKISRNVEKSVGREDDRKESTFRTGANIKSCSNIGVQDVKSICKGSGVVCVKKYMDVGDIPHKKLIREGGGESRRGNKIKGLLESMAENQSRNFEKRSHIAGDRYS